MSMQKFAPRERFEFSNGAIGWRPGGPFDCLGPWAKVQNCPIYGTDLRRTCYATGYADTHFSIPACTRVHGKYIGGYLTTTNDGGAEFHPLDRYKSRVTGEFDPSSVRYVEIIGRRWFQRTYGNTYHTAQVFFDGELVATVPRSYGYDSMYEQNAINALDRLGFMPGREPHEPGWRYFRDRHGCRYSSTAIDVQREKDM